jgi:hypothetical protein
LGQPIAGERAAGLPGRDQRRLCSRFVHEFDGSGWCPPLPCGGNQIGRLELLEPARRCEVTVGIDSSGPGPAARPLGQHLQTPPQDTRGESSGSR